MATSPRPQKARQLRLLRSYIAFLGTACHPRSRTQAGSLRFNLRPDAEEGIKAGSGRPNGGRAEKALRTALNRQAFARLTCKLRPIRIALRGVASGSMESAARPARRRFLPPAGAEDSNFTDAKSFLDGSVHKAFKGAQDDCDPDQLAVDNPTVAAKKAASQEKIDKLFAAQAAAEKAAATQAAATQSALGLGRQGSLAAPSRQASMAAPSRQGSFGANSWKGLIP